MRHHVGIDQGDGAGGSAADKSDPTNRDMVAARAIAPAPLVPMPSGDDRDEVGDVSERNYLHPGHGHSDSVAR